MVEVVKAFAIPNGGDMALVRLKTAVTHIKPVAIFARPLKKSDGIFIFSKIGGTSGAHDNRKGRGNGERIYHFKDPGGGRPGKAGDSGGAWVFRGRKPEEDALMGIIHGGGLGRQPAPCRKWITDKVAESGEKVKWLDVKFRTVDDQDRKKPPGNPD